MKLPEEWQRAFEIWDTMAREAAQYLATIDQCRLQQTRPELEAFPGPVKQRLSLMCMALLRH